MHYEVDVLTDTWLTGAADFPALQIPGALVSFEGSQGRSIQRIVGGKRYFGVTYSYRLIPLEPGVMTLPAFGLQTPVGQEEIPLRTRVPKQAFAVQALPAAEAAHITLLAGDVTLSQSLDPAGENQQAGQPLIREIRVQAQQAVALSIPSLAELSPTGSAGHAGGSGLQGQILPADVETITDPRGNAIGGERIERIRYIPEQGGLYQLPDLTLHWWDIDENRAKQSTLPALKIVVAANSAARPVWLWLLILPVAGITGWLANRRRNWIRSTAKAAKSRLRQRWFGSLAGTRSQAIRQLKRQPRELTGLYRLLERQNNAYSVRHSPLAPELQNRLIEGMSGYYSREPASEQSTRTLIRLIRRLK